MARETFLAPVRWDTDAWPVVNGNGTVSIDMPVHTLPQQPLSKPAAKVDFQEKALGFEWNYLGNPQLENYSLSARAGYLRLKPSDISLDSIGATTFVGRRQQHINFQASTSLDFASLKEGEEAGFADFDWFQYQVL